MSDKRSECTSEQVASSSCSTALMALVRQGNRISEGNCECGWCNLSLKTHVPQVVEGKIERTMLWEADEAFTVGTAVVVSPIGSVSFKGDVKKWEYPDGAGPATHKIYDTLTGIQTGRIADPYGWTVFLD